jgi:hypothetical protein
MLALFHVAEEDANHSLISRSIPWSSSLAETFLLSAPADNKHHSLQARVYS